MPLTPYGFVVGQYRSYHRDPLNDFGKYLHGHIDVTTPSGVFSSAIDVDSPSDTVTVFRKIVKLRPEEWSSLLNQPSGYHDLPSNASSGAVDYIRDMRLRTFSLLPTIRPPYHSDTVFLKKLLPLWRIIETTPTWKSGTGLEALQDLESLLPGAQRVLIFGQKYENANGTRGLHNVHQNQGDPVDSRWGPANGTWQDGITIIVYADGRMSAFMNRFSTQATRTDDHGNPLPGIPPALPRLGVSKL